MDLLTSDMSVTEALSPLDTGLHEAVDRADVCSIVQSLDEGAEVSSI